MKHYLLLSILFLSLSINDCFAQNYAINMEDIITKEQMISRFGKPDRYNEYEVESGIERNYWYGRTTIQTDENCVISFFISDNRFLVLTDLIPGGIRVGNSYAKICGTKYGTPVKASDQGEYYIQIYDERVFFTVKNNVIINISYSSSL